MTKQKFKDEELIQKLEIRPLEEAVLEYISK